MERRRSGGQHLLEAAAASVEGLIAQVFIACAHEVKKDDGCGNLAGQELDARCRGMDAKLQSVKVQTVRAGDDNLPIEHATSGQLRDQRVTQLRKVAVQRLAIAALDQKLLAIAEDDGAKAVPLGLKAPLNGRVSSVRSPYRNRVDALGEHGQQRGCEEEGHEHMIFAAKLIASKLFQDVEVAWGIQPALVLGNTDVPTGMKP